MSGDSKAPFEMPAYVIGRVMTKRGRLRVFDQFEAPETALIVIDMQKFYVSDVQPALDIIPNINRLAAGFRAKGALVAWVKMTAGHDGKSLWPLYHDYFFTKEAGARHRDNLTEGADGHALHPSSTRARPIVSPARAGSAPFCRVTPSFPTSSSSAASPTSSSPVC
jgi:ureidoacrylate peracid hydrolase